MKRRRSVITGIGPITCIGMGVENFWKGILTEKSGITRISSFDTSMFNAHCGGEISGWRAEEFFPPHRLKRLDRYAQFSVASAKMALDDAGLTYSREQPQHRIGVSFGTALGGVCQAEDQHIRFLKKGTRGVNPTLALQVFGGSAHSNIAIEFGFRGVGTTNSNSCASGTVSVGEALRYVRDDFADVVVAGGAEAALATLSYGAFDLIYAEVLGYSLNNDAFHMTSPLPGGESCIRAMREALADARIEHEQIDYINAHASSTQLNDNTETMSIKEVFGEQAKTIPVSGTKGYYAHPLGATGAIEAALCALALDRQWIPPTINYQNPDPACDLDAVPNHGRSAKLNYVMSNSFGFGGINACVVLGRIR